MGNLSVIPSGLPSAETVVANVTVLAIFASLVAAGIMRGLREVREFRKPATASTSSAAQIVGATILENVTLHEWTTSNGEVRVALDRLHDVIVKYRDELNEHRHEMIEHRRAIEDWRRDLRDIRGK